MNILQAISERGHLHRDGHAMPTFAEGGLRATIGHVQRPRTGKDHLVTNANNDPDMEKLHDLGRRIKANLQQMKDQGAFADSRAAFLNEAEERCAWIDKKLDAAVAAGDFFAATKLEAERDYDGLLLELRLWMERTDENATKASKI